jgi:hypothetical protein
MTLKPYEKPVRDFQMPKTKRTTKATDGPIPCQLTADSTDARTASVTLRQPLTR